MSFNGSGTYTLPGAALNTGDTVSATENNTLRNDMAASFNKTWLRDGTAAATADIPLGGFSLTGVAAIGSTTSLALKSNNGTTAVTIDTSQNVGIGTSATTYNYQVKNTVVYDAASAGLSVVGGSKIFTVAAQNAGGVFVGARSNDALIFTTNDTERARIDTTGNFQLGGNGGSATRFYAKGLDATSSNYGIYIQNTTPADLMWIRNDGVFNTGNATNSPYNANVGAVRTAMIASNGQLGYNASTRNSKTNIAPLTDVSWLFNLEPVSFNYREKDDEGNYTDVAKTDVHYGLIAEDAEPVNQKLCFYNNDGSLAGINYDMLAPALLKALQEQQALITTLTERITALEAK